MAQVRGAQAGGTKGRPSDRFHTPTPLRGPHHEDAPHGHHSMPKPLLIKVFAALVALTVFTVLTAQLDLGAFNVPLALTIATGKAALVVLFFMALKYDNRVNMLVFTVGVIMVIVFLTFTLFDTAFRGDIGNVDPETIADIERQEEVMRAEAFRLGLISAEPMAGAADTTAVADTTAAGAAGADTTAAGASAPDGATAADSSAADERQ